MKKRAHLIEKASVLRGRESVSAVLIKGLGAGRRLSKVIDAFSS